SAIRDKLSKISGHEEGREAQEEERKSQTEHRSFSLLHVSPCQGKPLVAVSCDRMLEAWLARRQECPARS
ncbi:hypothetical protein ACQP3J_31765, partial [Escherichia coli]